MKSRNFYFKKLYRKLFLDYSHLLPNEHTFPYSGSYLLAKKTFNELDETTSSEHISFMLENLQTAVELEHPDAMYITGVLFEHGIGAAKDITTAFEFFQEAKNFGNLDAEFKLAQCYFLGSPYCEQDESRALAILHKLTLKGHPNSCGLLGDLYAEESNPDVVYISRILDYYFNAAQGGLDKYAYKTTFLYYLLPYVEAERYEIMSLASELSQINTAEGLFCKAVFALKSASRQKDIETIEQSLIESAESGFVYAQVLLARLYQANDINFPIDIKKSIKYLKMAAEQKDNSAILSLGIYYLISENVDKQKAHSYFFSFEDDCTFSFEKFFSYNSIFGIKGIKNFEVALSFYEKEANNKNDDAAFILGAIFYNLCNFDKAFSFLMKFEKSNHPKGLFYLSLCYFHGLGIEKNLSQAKKYCSLAIAAGNKVAQDLLNKIEIEMDD